MARPSRPLSDGGAAARKLVAAVAAIAFLHWARSILVPVSLAMILGFAATPVVHALRRIGLGHAQSVLGVVSCAIALVLWLGVHAVTHALQIGDQLPAYRQTFESNVGELRRVAWQPIENTLKAANDMLKTPAAVAPDRAHRDGAPAQRPVVLSPSVTPSTDRLRRLLSWAWEPLASTALVVVVMIFALLEREALRDRFIRLVGGSDVRTATTAVNDAGERLARYLARLFTVNIGFGVVLWLALAAIGLPYAALLATVTVTLRFLPFLGVPIAALLALLLALAATPGWALALWTLSVFAAVELVVSQAVEPRIYGRATGLSPFAIVLAATFWGWLWGPVGVLVATPLTLCLAVAGRHVPSFAVLGILLGDEPALTLAQKFYQRALSGDPAEIIGDARGFLARHAFAEYCDAVLVPALQLGRVDRERGRITMRQYADLRSAIGCVLAGLDGAERGRLPAIRDGKSLASILAGSLRWRRPSRGDGRQPEVARRAGSAAGSAQGIVLCAGMGSQADELAADLLVRILRAQGMDARHIKGEDDLCTLALYGITSLDVQAVCVVGMTDRDAPEQGVGLARKVRSVLPHARSLGLLLPGILEHPQQLAVRRELNGVSTSFVDAARAIRPCVRGRIQSGRGASLVERA
jgi:predicted PurR-regulated permease PerM